MKLIENLGFTSPPFEKTNADEEPNLAEYFIPPPFFNSIIGTPKTPNATVVFAPRGAGKTAQRRMVEREGIKNKFLAVTYDRFELTNNLKIQDISLDYHLRNIIIRILLSILSYATDYPDLIKNFTKNEKKQFNLFIQTYLGNMTGDDVQELMSELKGIPERFSKFWRDNVSFIEPIVAYLLKSNNLDVIDPEKISLNERKLSGTYKYQLEQLLKYTQKIGFDSIYILIDKIDETEQTGNNPEHSYILIKPLLKDLDLLGIKGFGFKFFLWDKIEPYYRKDARSDRVSEYTLKWKRQTLKAALELRFKYFSGGKLSGFSSVIKGDGFDIDNVVCLMANGSPRNMIRLSDRILAIQSEKEELSEIELSSVDQASVDYSEKLFKENYDEDLLKIIQKIGREIFTINHLANNIFKITTQGARSKLKVWLNIGLVQQVGSVTGKGSKPINLYCIADPIAVRLIHRKEPIVEFIQNRWLPCGYCSTDNLVDINLYPEDNEPSCRGCGRNIV